MKYTTNLDLKKPDYTDVVDINDINDNMDTIDIAIQGKAEVSAIPTKLSDLEADIQIGGGFEVPSGQYWNYLDNVVAFDWFNGGAGVNGLVAISGSMVDEQANQYIKVTKDFKNFVNVYTSTTEYHIIESSFHYVNNNYVLVTTQGNADTGDIEGLRIFISSDGVDWSADSYINIPLSAKTPVQYIGGNYVLYASNNEDILYRVLINGTTHVASATTTGITTADYIQVTFAYYSGLYNIAVLNGDTGTMDIYSSPNGTTLTLRKSFTDFLLPDGYQPNIYLKGSRRIILGKDGVYTSTNGTSWTNSRTIKDANMTLVGDTLYLIGQDPSIQETTYVYTSTDGSVWNRILTSNFHPGFYEKMYSIDNELYIQGGEESYNSVQRNSYVPFVGKLVSRGSGWDLLNVFNFIQKPPVYIDFFINDNGYTIVMIVYADSIELRKYVPEEKLWRRIGSIPHNMNWIYSYYFSPEVSIIASQFYDVSIGDAYDKLIYSVENELYPSILDAEVAYVAKQHGTLGGYVEAASFSKWLGDEANVNIFTTTKSTEFILLRILPQLGIAGVQSQTLILKQKPSTASAIVFSVDSNVSLKWQGGQIPDLSKAGATYLLTFLYNPSDAEWLGMFGGEF